MRVRSTLLLAVLAVALAGLSTPASARTLSVNDDDFSMQWPSLEFLAAVGTVRCSVLLSGSFHRRVISKTAGLLVGAITGATVSRCEGGEARALTGTLPWHLRYVAFGGTLPVIRSLTLSLVGASFAVTIAGATCLARTDSTEPAVLIVSVDELDGDVHTLRADEAAEIDLEDDDFLCSIAGDAAFAGTGSMGGTSAHLALDLI
jgi:hypothetical protein